MEEVGTVTHLAKSGRIIIKVNRWLEPGTILLDSKGRRLAKVTEIIGPVKSPYATAIPLTERVERAIGDKTIIALKARKGGKIGRDD
ncbi:MAG: H/ACA ribonucleoprotein complex subunit GAR1 [Nitrososphaerales archaeon]